MNTLAIATVTAAIAVLTPQIASAERVCKEVCNAGICKQECIETEGRGDRRDRIEERREERREERGPGIDLRLPLPVPDIRVGPPHS
jgi:hypothetical protein